MKILHVVPSISPASGGPARAVVDFANILAEKNSITIAATDEDFEKQDGSSVAPKIGLHKDVTLKLFSFKGTHSSKFSVFLLRWFKHELIQFDVVHIHAAFSIMSSYAAKECRRQGIPYIFRPLGTLSQYSMNTGNTQFKSWYWRYIEQKTCATAKCIHVTSETEAQELRLLGINTPAKVSPLPVSVKGAAKDKRKKPLKIGVLTRLHPKKNLEAFLIACEQLSDTFDFTIDIAGSGDLDYESKLQEIAERPGLNGKVRFAGFVDGAEKEAFWKQLDYYVLPSHHENFGRAVAEALARGIPVLISKKVDICPAVKRYNCGFVCDTTLESIKMGLENMLSQSEEAYHQQSENAIRCVEEEFHPDNIALQLQEMYEMPA